MSSLRAPGVYTATRASRAILRTMHSITGFVGLAPMGPLDTPQKLTSWSDYEQVFGGIVVEFELGVAVYGFFANGGQICYVVRIADRNTMPTSPNPEVAHWEMLNSDSKVVLTASARHVGTWAGGLVLQLRRDTTPLALTTLTANATGTPQITIASAVDLRVGSQITIVAADNPEQIFAAEITNVPSATTCDLDRPITGVPSGSQVIAPGFAFTVTLGDYTETFTQLSLEPTHARSIERIVNGSNAEHQELHRSANGNSRLVEIAVTGSSTDLILPLRGIETQAAVTIPPLPPDTRQLLSNLRLPTDIPISYVEPKLHFAGIMTARQEKILLAVSADPNYQSWIVTLRSASAIWQWDPARVAVAPPRLGVDPHLPIDYRHFTGYDDAGYFPIANPVDGDYRGLATLEAIEEVCLISIVDLENASQDARVLPNNPRLAVQRKMLDHCVADGARFALLDAPPVTNTAQPVNDTLDHAQLLTQYPGAANSSLYYPYLLVPAIAGITEQRTSPPSGFAAGVYAQVENLEGVHRSPANIGLQAVVDTTFKLEETDNARLNAQGVNCIRAFTNQSVRIWGARTLSNFPQWRYVGVRRVLLAIKKEIEVALGWATFEPNNVELQRSVAATLNSYMNGLFQGGVLAGTSPDEAFFVTLEPPMFAEENQLIAHIGFAPLQPAEYIVATVSRAADGFSVAVGPEVLS